MTGRRRRDDQPRPYVDAAPARDHLRGLLTEPDVTRVAICDATGLSERGVRRILAGATHIQQSTHRYLTDLTVERVRSYARLPRERTLQQLRSLQANGWTTTQLGRMLGHTRLALVYKNDQTYVRAATAAAVDALYHRLGDSPGPSKRAADAARKLGWYPPIHYDDQGRFIAESVPPKRRNGSDVERIYRRRFTAMRVILDGGSVADAARAVGVTDRQVERYKAEVGFQHGNRTAQTRLRGAVERVTSDATLDPLAEWDALRTQHEKGYTVTAGWCNRCGTDTDMTVADDTGHALIVDCTVCGRRTSRTTWDDE